MCDVNVSDSVGDEEDKLGRYVNTNTFWMLILTVLLHTATATATCATADIELIAATIFCSLACLTLHLC